MRGESDGAPEIEFIKRVPIPAPPGKEMLPLAMLLFKCVVPNLSIYGWPMTSFLRKGPSYYNKN